MNRRRIPQMILVMLLSIVTIYGCASGEGPAGGQPVIPPENLIPSPPPTADIAATQAAEATAQAALALVAEATQSAIVSATKEALITQLVLDRESTVTQEANLKLTATVEIFQQKATAQAQSMLSEVQRLYQNGVIDSTVGDYFRLAEFDQSWAKLDYYQWWLTGMAAEEFVMSGDAFVSSASDNANWFESACGISFSLLDAQNHDVIWIAMDGRAGLMTVHKDVRKLLVINRFGEATKTDFQVRYLLVVHDKHITLYIDGQEIFSVYDGLLGSGAIATTLISGTNKGYGTRCKNSNINLWIIK